MPTRLTGGHAWCRSAGPGAVFFTVIVEQLVDTVVEALRRAGLARRADALEAGGYGVQPAYPMSPPEVGAYVV